MTLANNKLSKYLRESYDELRKVVWPTREVTRNHTIIVIVFSLFVALYFAGLDYALNILIEKLI